MKKIIEAVDRYKEENKLLCENIADDIYVARDNRASAGEYSIELSRRLYAVYFHQSEDGYIIDASIDSSTGYFVESTNWCLINYIYAYVKLKHKYIFGQKWNMLAIALKHIPRPSDDLCGLIKVLYEKDRGLASEIMTKPMAVIVKEVNRVYNRAIDLLSSEAMNKIAASVATPGEANESGNGTANSAGAELISRANKDYYVFRKSAMIGLKNIIGGKMTHSFESLLRCNLEERARPFEKYIIKMAHIVVNDLFWLYGHNLSNPLNDDQARSFLIECSRRNGKNELKPASSWLGKISRVIIKEDFLAIFTDVEANNKETK